MSKVLILAKDNTPSAEVYKKLLSEHGIEYAFGSAHSDAELAEIGNDCEAMIFSSTKFTDDTFTCLPNLKLLSRAGIGVDTVDMDAATKHGVTVCNCPSYGTYDVAEHAVALMLSLSHSIPVYDSNIKTSNCWSSKGVPMAHRLNERKLGIIGFGRISRWICKMMKGFGIEIMVYDPYINEEVAKELDVTPVSLETLAKESDIISVNAPLTKDTFHLVNAELIAKMKNSVLLINTSRGPLVDEKALIDALESGKIAGAALDVFEKEPFEEDCKLRSMKNVVLTPHIAWNSEEAVRDLNVEVIGNVVDFFEGKALKNALNIKR